MTMSPMCDGQVELAVAVKSPGHDGRPGIDPRRVRDRAGWNVPSPLPSSTE